MINAQSAINGLDAGMVMQVTGDPAAGAATINGYVGPGPVNYIIANFIIVDEGDQAFDFLNINTNAPVAVTAGAANVNFQGLTFTAFRYTPVPAPTGLVIMDGSTIVDLMLNRTDGLAFPNGSQFSVDAVVFDQENNEDIPTNICRFYVGPAPRPGIPNGTISIIPGALYGRKIDGDAIVTITRVDSWTNIAPPAIASTICLEVLSEPSL